MRTSDCARPRKQAQAPRARKFSTWCADRQAKAAVDIEAAGTALGLDFYEFSFVTSSARESKPCRRRASRDGDGRRRLRGLCRMVGSRPSSGVACPPPALTQLPWNPRVGYSPATCVAGDYLDHAPRNAARAMCESSRSGARHEDRRRVRVFYWTRRRAPWRTVWKSTRECRQLEI